MDTVYDLVMKWNDRLRAARDAAGVTDTDITRACGVKNSSVNGWMTGATKTIEGENLLKVCAFLSTTPEWIIFGKKAEKPATPDFDLEFGRALELMAIYKESSADAREFILRAARMAKSSADESAIDGDKSQAGL